MHPATSPNEDFNTPRTSGTKSSRKPKTSSGQTRPESLLYGVAAGFILDRLPIFRILGAFLRLLLMAFKPAILVYGATKLYQVIKADE